MTTLSIKNMVCPRCLKVVQKELENQGLHPLTVVLGEVTLQESPEQIDTTALSKALAQHGFQLLEDKKSRMVEKIKNTIIELIHHRPVTHAVFSHQISERLGMEYTYLSSLFSASEGMTIEKYSILQRIERVKELLVYDELSLRQIADQVGYSSVAHLSNQFRNVTGQRPSEYKKRTENNRYSLDEI